LPESILVHKLQTVTDLSVSDREQLHQLCHEVGRVHAKNDIISEGNRPERVHLIVRGWAARYKLLADGRRQITAFLIPGDFCDLHVAVLGYMDHGIVAISECHVAYIDSKELDRVTSENSRLAKSMWWSTLVDEATLRQWVVNVGRRDAYQRIAHILCEMYSRMSLVGLVADGRLALPLTQDDLADATGLTPVHVNRTLQRLRKEGLIEIGSGRLHILDIVALRNRGGFDSNYLHIERRLH
jgi:CRP-like cAMP-binding protein